MTKKPKRTGLNSLISLDLSESPKPEENLLPVESPLEDPATPKKTDDIKYQTLYLPKPVHRQLRELANEEDKKLHDLYLEGINLVLKKRGLKSIAELTKNQKYNHFS